MGQNSLAESPRDGGPIEQSVSSSLAPGVGKGRSALTRGQSGKHLGALKGTYPRRVLSRGPVVSQLPVIPAFRH